MGQSQNITCLHSCGHNFQKLLHATSIILVHNHPSGTRNPSRQDISLTKKAIEAGKIMEIELVDHLIITREGYYSLKDNGDI